MPKALTGEEMMNTKDGDRLTIVRMDGKNFTDRCLATVKRDICACRTDDGAWAFFELYGKTWLAYRNTE